MLSKRFAVVTPRQLAPSVGRTRAGITVLAASIFINDSNRQLAGFICDPRSNLHHGRHLHRQQHWSYRRRLVRSNLAAAFCADTRTIQSTSCSCPARIGDACGGQPTPVASRSCCYKLQDDLPRCCCPSPNPVQRGRSDLGALHEDREAAAAGWPC